LDLQEKAGNQAVQWLLRAGLIHAKLSNSRPDDPDEREADAVADRIAGQGAPKCACAGGTPCPKCAGHADFSHQRPTGGPLPHSERAYFEQFLGRDFSRVRTHEFRGGGEIRAFTAGNDIAFAPGEYAPGTAAGRALLAHELTHVVQQSTRSDVRRLQADAGAISPQEMEGIKQWVATQGRPFGTVPYRFPDRFQPLEPGEFRFGDGFHPTGPPPGTICPNCHKTPLEQWREKQQHDEELRQWKIKHAESERKAQLEAAWPGMIEEQHKVELAQQAKSLREDVESSEILAAQLRLQMFEKALATPSIRGFFSAGEATPAMRDAWAAAQQATLVLQALLRSAKEEVPSELTEPFRLAYTGFYTTLTGLLTEQDREDARFMEEMAHLPKMRQPTLCPGPCHQPASEYPSYGHEPEWRKQPALLTANTPAKGPNRKRLDEAMVRASSAASNASWGGVLRDFDWATGQVDQMLRARVYVSGQELLEQFDYVQERLQRQRMFYADHPDAMKVRAVFYPNLEFTEKADEKGVKREVAKGIPWDFYITHNPETSEWQLHDLTAPRRDNRTVKTQHQVTLLESHFRNVFHDVDPPYDLFRELNNADFFPEGMLYWVYPISGAPGHLETTAPWSFGTWLKAIGMTIAIVGILLAAPYSAPLAFGLMVAGTGLSIAGSVVRLREMEEHGILTDADLNRFYWDLALDIVSMVTMGLGTIAKVSAAAGNLVRAGQAMRAYAIVRRVQLGMDIVNIAVIGDDILKQIHAIQNSNMTADQKQRAYTELGLFATLSLGMAFAAVRSGIKEISMRPPVGLDVDSAGRLVADVEGTAMAADHAGPGAPVDMKHIETLTFAHPETGEIHTYYLYPNGRITRCSEPPCTLIVESIVGRVSDIAEEMPHDSAHYEELQELLQRARALRESAEGLARQSAEALTANRGKLLQQARKIEEDIYRFERKVAGESEVLDSSAREVASERYGPEALNYSRKYYRWERYEGGTKIRFVRRTRGVPQMDFNSATKKFEVTQPLFVPASEERLQTIRATSETRTFPIEATIDSIADLRRLRPGRVGAKPLGGGWVIVKINDNNLVDFLEEAVPERTIFEYPDGSRVWRTPENTIATEGALRAPIGRRGWEQTVPPALRVTPEGESNAGVDVVGATGVEHQRAHPRGSGTGFEMTGQIPFAPTYINQELQNRGIELYLAEVQRLHPDVDLRLSTEHATISGTKVTRRQQWIDYSLDAVSGGKKRSIFKVRIETNYNNPTKPGKPILQYMTSNREDLAMLGEVDMPEALATLAEKIKARRGAKR